MARRISRTMQIALLNNFKRRKKRQVAGSGIEAIDMMSGTLDSRITYTGPSHAYYDMSGDILYTAANEWPLEYRYGEVVGRHPPEGASTNLLPDSLFATSVWSKSSGSTWTIETTDIGTTGIVGDATNVLTAVYNSATTSFVAAEANPGTGSSWGDAIRKFSTAAGALRWYAARQSSGMYIYGSISTAVVAGSYVASVIRKLDSSGMHCTLPQVEAGAIRTSPILNTGSQTNTRTAASVTVAKDGDAIGVTVNFSDDTSTDIDFSGDSLALPLSSADWGTRYITSIEYRV